MKKFKPRLILASNSIGRKQLLEKLGVEFQVIPSQIDEDIIIHTNQIKMIQMRAKAKGEDVCKRLAFSKLAFSKKYSSKQNSKRYTLDARCYLILAADSMAILNGKTYGKAKTKLEGKKLLEDLMGKTHDFVTATSIIFKSLKSPKLLKWNHVTTTRVTLRKLTSQELDSYVSYFDFTRFAAGYAFNEKPWDIVTKIDGSYTNVIGLPFEIVLPIFRQFELVK
jgi:septum formation protein